MQSPQFYHHTFSYGSPQDDADDEYRQKTSSSTPAPPLLTSARSKVGERTPYTALFESRSKTNDGDDFQQKSHSSTKVKRGEKIEPLHDDYLLYPQRPTPIYSNPIPTVGSAEKEYNTKYNNNKRRNLLVDTRTPEPKMATSSSTTTSPVPYQPSVSPFLSMKQQKTPLQSPAIRTQASSSTQQTLDTQNKNTTVLSTAGRFGGGAALDEQGVLQARFVAPMNSEQRNRFVETNRGKNNNKSASPTRKNVPISVHEQERLKFIEKSERAYQRSPTFRREFKQVQNYADGFTAAVSGSSPSQQQQYVASTSTSDVEKWYLTQKERPSSPEDSSSPSPTTKLRERNSFTRNSRMLSCETEHEFVNPSSSTPTRTPKKAAAVTPRSQKKISEEEFVFRGTNSQSASAKTRDAQRLSAKKEEAKRLEARNAEYDEEQRPRSPLRLPLPSPKVIVNDLVSTAHHPTLSTTPTRNSNAMMISPPRHVKSPASAVVNQHQQQELSPMPHVYANEQQNDSSFYTDVVESISSQQQQQTPRKKQIVSPPRFRYSPAKLMSTNTSGSNPQTPNNSYHQQTEVISHPEPVVRTNRSSVLRRQATEENNRTPTPTRKQRILNDFKHNNSARNSAKRQRMLSTTPTRQTSRNPSSRPVSPSGLIETPKQKRSNSASTMKMALMKNKQTSIPSRSRPLSPREKMASPTPTPHYQTGSVSVNNDETNTKRIQTPSRPSRFINVTTNKNQLQKEQFVISPIKQPRASSPPSATFKKRQALHEKRQASLTSTSSSARENLSAKQKQQQKEKQLAMPWNHMIQTAKREGFSEDDLIRLSWPSLKGLLDHFGVVHPVQVAQIQVQWTRKREQLSLDTKSKLFRGNSAATMMTRSNESQNQNGGRLSSPTQTTPKRAKSVSFAAPTSTSSSASTSHHQPKPQQQQHNHIDPALLVFPVQEEKVVEKDAELHRFMPKEIRAPRQF